MRLGGFRVGSRSGWHFLCIATKRAESAELAGNSAWSCNDGEAPLRSRHEESLSDFGR